MRSDEKREKKEKDWEDPCPKKFLKWAEKMQFSITSSQKIQIGKCLLCFEDILYTLKIEQQQQKQPLLQSLTHANICKIVDALKNCKFRLWQEPVSGTFRSLTHMRNTFPSVENYRFDLLRHIRHHCYKHF